MRGLSSCELGKAGLASQGLSAVLAAHHDQASYEFGIASHQVSDLILLALKLFDVDILPLCILGCHSGLAGVLCRDCQTQANVCSYGPAEPTHRWRLQLEGLAAEPA